MKRYLDQQQTAKLIELGFDKPKSVTEISWQEDEKDNPIINANTIEYTRHYSIGELIEMLPDVVESEDSEYATLQMYFDLFNWVIEYTGVEKTEYATSAIELIDALYDMLVKLKEEGVI